MWVQSHIDGKFFAKSEFIVNELKDCAYSLLPINYGMGEYSALG
jgi:hypothetical protein